MEEVRQCLQELVEEVIDLSITKPPSLSVQHLIYVLDESGSMFSRQQVVLSGVEEFREEQLRLQNPQKTVLVSMLTFSTEVRTLFTRKPLSEMVPLTSEDYHPQGLTALYDAIHDSLQCVNHMDEKTILIVLTDGQENASQRVTSRGQLQTELDRKKQDGKLEVVFLGSNLDDIQDAAGSVGAAPQSTLPYNDDRLEEALSAVASAVGRATSGVSPGIFFTPHERSSSSSSSPFGFPPSRPRRSQTVRWEDHASSLFSRTTDRNSSSETVIN
jgi:hypothetical protein